MLLSFVIVVPTYAHLTGAFANFLAIVYDDSTISQLHKEMDETRKEIMILQPQVESLEAEFLTNKASATEQLQFYTEMGLDMWLTLLQDGQDVTDLLGNQWVLEKKIDVYLQSLNDLYVLYKQLLTEQQSLEGHVKLLQVIEKNLQARESFLQENADLPLEQIANYLDIDWTAEVEKPIIADLTKDQKLVKAHVLDWVQRSSGMPYVLDESWLNEQSQVHYFFRADHVYLVYELEFAHVILLGQVLQDEGGESASLQLEAGFYNGFYLPEELLVELPSFTIDYNQLMTLDGITQPYLKQVNGGLTLQTK